MKPGWKTSEFWTHLGVLVALNAGSVVTGYLMTHTAALPLWLAGPVLMLGPVVSAWLQKEYADNRTELKAASPPSAP